LVEEYLLEPRRCPSIEFTAEEVATNSFAFVASFAIIAEDSYVASKEGCLILKFCRNC